MNENITWFKDAKFGMMIHWGLYSLLAGEYQGQASSSYAEWIQSKFQIPNAEYELLANSFNPIYFNADEIVSFAKSCNMQYLVFTTKHHDGFAMYHSKVDAYNCYDATPFKRDILKELATACQKAGIKLGIYYSQDLDWHHYHGGGYQSNHLQTAGTTWDNSWDFQGPKNFQTYFETKALPQIDELMSNYGEIATAWFDMPMTLTQEQSQAIYDLVKHHQPNCLINSRLGNGQYDYVSLGDNEIPKQKENAQKQTIDYNTVDGFKPSPYDLYETAGTINNSWGFSYHDYDFKSAKQLFNQKQHLNQLGINYLLNVGLDGLGRIPMPSQKALREMSLLEKKYRNYKNYKNYLKLNKLSYGRAIEYLNEKYGKVTHAYKQPKGSKSDRGLERHHICEFSIPNLGSDEKRKNYPELQKKELLVYCNIIEHAILHKKIDRKRREKNLFGKGKIENWYINHDEPESNHTDLNAYNAAYLNERDAQKILELLYGKTAN